MISDDLRWRAVVLTFIYGIEQGIISDILGVGVSSIKRWTQIFQLTGNITNKRNWVTRSRYPNDVLIWIDDYAKSNPCFYIEELQSALKVKFPTVTNILDFLE
jgi:transposase